MAFFRKKNPETNRDDLVTDDFIYDDPDSPSSSAPDQSDTPEEALRKLRGRRAASSPKRKGGRRGAEEESAAPSPENRGGEAGEEQPRGFWQSSSGMILDEDLQPVYPKRERRRHPVLRVVMLTLITLVLIVIAAAYIFHRIAPGVPGLDVPETAIGRIVSPVQSLFSGVTESIAGYFRTLKFRANLESAYESLRAENEQLVYKAMLAEELQNTISQYEDLSDEIRANAGMKPIVCSVIGKSDGNYFSTFTINKGSDDGIEEYMAVTISGALVGYTENVQPTMSTVRTIIDSEASIAALIQSSRDQGTVSGTLGLNVDGPAMCRMYYLPDENLPRPGDTVVTSGVGMSFPKGIPIGTVRESTRGMDSNKQYIVLEPLADFQHLEYVIVLRYKPVPEAIEGRENGRTNVQLVPLTEARPSPQVPQIASSLFESQLTPDPNATATPTVEPTPTPSPTPTPTPAPSPTPDTTNLVYVPVDNRKEPTPTPSPSPEPTPTPYEPPDPAGMVFDDGEE